MECTLAFFCTIWIRRSLRSSRFVELHIRMLLTFGPKLRTPKNEAVVRFYVSQGVSEERQGL